MRRSSLVVALLATNGVAHPAERRTSIGTGVGVSTNAIDTYGNLAGTILSQIQSDLKLAQSAVTGTAASGQAQVVVDLGSLTAATTTLQNAITSGLALAGSGTVVAQSDLDSLSNAVDDLQDTVNKIASTAKSVITSTNAKTSAQITAATDSFNKIMTSLTGVTTALQTFAGGVTTNANSSKQALTANVSDLGKEVAQLLQSIAGSFGIGASIDLSALGGSNGFLNAASVANLVNGIFGAINSAVSQAVNGAPKVTLTLPTNLPGITIKPITFTIPGFTFGGAAGAPTTTSQVPVPTTPTVPTSAALPSTTAKAMTTPAPSTTTPKITVTPVPTTAPVSNGNGGEVITIKLPFFTYTITVPRIGLPEPTGGVSGGVGLGLGLGLGLGQGGIVI